MFPLWMVLLITLGVVVSDEESFEGYRLVETDIMSEEVARNLTEEPDDSWDFWMRPGPTNGAVIFLAPEQLPDAEDTLKKHGVSYEIHIPDLDDSLINPNTTTDERGAGYMFDRYHSLTQIHTYLQEMAKKYPKKLTLHEAGVTYYRRSIKYVEISNGVNKEKEKAIFIDAGIHAREWISISAALYVIHQLVENYETNMELLDGVRWYILPVLNPDGYEYSRDYYKWWIKNRSRRGKLFCSGVDLNRNFPDHWCEKGGSKFMCSDRYCGRRATSEYETQALQKIVMAHKSEISIYLSLHSYGQMMLHPFGYTTKPSEDHKELRDLLEKAAAAVEKVRGTKYKIGSASTLLYLNSGRSDDWAKNVAGIKYSYTFHLPPKGGKKFHPDPSQILPICKETYEALKVFANHGSNIQELYLTTQGSL